MVRVQSKATVVYGKFREYFDAVEQMAKLSADRGWAPLKVWAPIAGSDNEVLIEWEFENLTEYEQANRAMMTDAEFMELLRVASEFLYPQSSTTSLFESAYQIA